MTEREYRKIVKEGRAAEVLREYVKRSPGRPKKEDALTNAERQRLYRQRQKKRRATGKTGGTP